MFGHSLHSDFPRTTAFHWFLMSFLAGSVNAGGFLACERFVTHVTGFATLAGIDLGHGDWGRAASMMSVPMFYLLGSMIAAALTVWRRHRGLEPRYTATLILVTLCLVTVTICGSLDMFGTFGGSFSVEQNYVFLALLCLASGLQNAALTSSSGSTVRTTHLTGITTDLGIGLVEAFAFRRDPAVYRLLDRKNAMRLGTIVAFMVGGTIGAVVYLRWQYLGFLLPSSVAIYGVIISLAGRRTQLRA